MEVQDDGNVITKENAGVTPGLDPVAWLTDQQEKRPYLWGVTQGGGAGGARNKIAIKDNPWTRENWNLTAQGRVMRDQGMEKAKEMAAQAGSKVDAIAPPPEKK